MPDYTRLIPGMPTGTPVAERTEHGMQARDKQPHETWADWQPPADRPRALDLLLGQETTRLQALVPIRHARMAESPFTFYRGSAVVMASDLGRSPNSDLWAQLCGDAHLSNFGVFGSPERNLIFDLNDFDETHPGPFEWDILRLAASFVLAARDRGLTGDEATRAAILAVEAYQFTMTQAAARPYLDNWYTMITPDLVRGLVRQSEAVDAPKAKKEKGKKGKKASKGASGSGNNKAEKRFNKEVAKMRSRDTWSAVRKLTEVGPDGHRRFLNQPPFLTRIENIPVQFEVTQELFASLAADFVNTMPPDRASLISRYTLMDVAHKVVGVGSVGLPALIGLLAGRDEEDIMVLQFKAAQKSVLEEWTRDSVFDHPGQRVVVGQRLMQATGDPFLGWVTGPAGTAFYGRQLRDFKWSMDIQGLSETRLEGYAMLCGGTLALAHARAGDPIALSAYMGTDDSWAQAVGAFSVTYADLVEQDYAEFSQAIADGDIEVAEQAY